MKILSGSLKETLFHWPEEGKHGSMKQCGSSLYTTDSVTYINGRQQYVCVCIVTLSVPLQIPWGFIAWRTPVTQTPLSLCTSTVPQYAAASVSTSAQESLNLARSHSPPDVLITAHNFYFAAFKMYDVLNIYTRAPLHVCMYACMYVCTYVL